MIVSGAARSNNCPVLLGTSEWSVETVQKLPYQRCRVSPLSGDMEKQPPGP